MRTLLDRMRTQLSEFFGKLSTRSKVLLGILAAFVIILAIVIAVLLSRVNYALLYTAETMGEAGAVIEALRGMNVPYQAEGTRVYIPENRVSEVRNQLAYEGVIGSDEPDLSIMQGASGFGVTEAHQKKLYEAQTAAYIRSQLLVSGRIQKANVTINYGESSPFVKSSGVKDATATVMLVIQGDAMLTKTEQQSIAELVRNNVPGVRYENITITDSNLNYYPVREELFSEDVETFDPIVEINSRIAMQSLFSQRLQTQAEQLLIPMLGMSNVSVAVTVRLNFDKEVIESVVFNPPVAGELDGVVRSSSELWETQKTNGNTAGIPGTDPNGMGTAEYPYGTLDDGEQYRRMVDEKNYEINETRTLIEKEQGKIVYLSIGVMINSEAIAEEDIPKVANIVSRGFGVEPENVAVERVAFPFRDTGIGDNYTQWEEFEAQTQRQALLRTIIICASILLLGIVVMIIIRSIVKSLRPPPEPVPVLVDGGVAVGMGVGAGAGVGGINYIVDEDFGGEEEEEAPEEIEDIELPKKSAGLEQIERFIDKDPVAVAQLLRNWLSDE